MYKVHYNVEHQGIVHSIKNCKQNKDLIMENSLSYCAPASCKAL